MDRNEFTGQVLAQLRRLTPEEQQAVKQELEDHMEDRIEGLLELGWSPETAEERTLAAMGDPEEIGRELDKQYPPGWLWLGRAAFVLTTVMCIFAVLGIGVWGFTIDSITARFSPPYSSHVLAPKRSMDVDIRIPVGNDILRVSRVAVGYTNDGHLDTRLTAEVSLCVYDRIPGGLVSTSLLNKVELWNQRRDDENLYPWQRNGTVNGGGHAKRWYGCVIVEIQPGDTYVTLEYDRFGESFSIDLPLPEEVSP